MIVLLLYLVKLSIFTSLKRLWQWSLLWSQEKNYMSQKYSPVLLDLMSTFHWHNNQRGKKYLFEIWHTNITETLLTETKWRFQNHYYTPQLKGALWLVSLEDYFTVQPVKFKTTSLIFTVLTVHYGTSLILLWFMAEKTWSITYSKNLYLGY